MAKKESIFLSKTNIAFIIIVLFYSIYASAFIYRTSFIIGDERFYTLFDDAMISMRYAMNFANGYGLVWNPGGERVEGFTNPLWVLYMAVIHLLPLAQSKFSLVIQITAMLLLMVNLYYIKKIAYIISKGSNAVSLGAVLLTSFYLPINNWSLQGMEVGLLVLLTSISLYHTIQCSQNKKFCPWLYILLGITTTVRIDMILPSIGILVFLAFVDRGNRIKNITWGLIILLCFILLQTMFRIWYYEEILPNTYYLKLTGYPLFLRITRGIFVFFNFIYHLNWVLFLASFSIFFFNRERSILLLIWLFSIQAFYSIYVGGDAWENWGGSNRYLCIAMPSFFILFSLTLNSFCRYLAAVFNKTTFFSERINKYSREFSFIILLILCLLSFNSLYGPKALSEFLLISPPIHALDNKLMVEQALLLKKITSEEAKIAIVWAGSIPYFSHRYAIDILGKNDKRIANERMRTISGKNKFIFFFPGHLKYNYNYSIGYLKPDVVVQIWHSPEEAKPYLASDYSEFKFKNITMYLRNESMNIKWDEVKLLDKNINNL